MGGKSSSAVRYPWLDPPFIGKSTFLSALPPEQDLLLGANHLFVAAIAAEVHAGCRDRQVRGQSAFEAVTFYGQQKQLRRPLPLV